MNKFLVFSIVGALVVGGTAVTLLFKTDTTEVTPIDRDTEELEVKKEDSLPTNGQATLSNLLSRLQDLECTISYKVDDSGDQEISGTYFTSNNRMRGDFIVPVAEIDSVSSVIMRDRTLYSWSEINGEKYGIKIDMDALEQQRRAGEVPETNEPVPLDAQVQYDCKPWLNVDGSIFEPPSDIIFKDFSTVISGGMEFGTIYEESSDNTTQCDLCAQVPAGEGRDSCNLAFNCQ